MRHPRSVHMRREARLDAGVLLLVLALLTVGLLAIYSATHLTDGNGRVLRQAIWAAGGLLGMGIFAGVDYRAWMRHGVFLFITTLVMLVLTLLLAREINGARSWIDLGAFRLQPSEFAKLAMILAFAALLVKTGAQQDRWPVFLRNLGIFCLPIVLVLAQPDFGTAMVLCMIWLVMVWLAGVRWWMIGAVAGAAVLLFLAAWYLPLPGGRTLIKNYQKQRLDFLNADPAGSGYHQLQARIAIGAGELRGKGYLQGTQAKRGFLPEQDTDFIFAVIGEEFGFIGCAVVLALYALLLFRLLRIAEEAESPFARLITGGVTAMLMVHAVINIGMCLTLSPVTGVPLPFVSYGGSNLLTNLLAIGVVLNISRHRQAQRAWAATEQLVRL